MLQRHSLCTPNSSHHTTSIGRHRLSGDALGVPLVRLDTLEAGNASGRAGERGTAALSVGTGGSTSLGSRGSGSRSLGGGGLGNLSRGRLGGSGLGRGGLGGGGSSGLGSGAGAAGAGAGRDTRLPAALAGELVPPVAEHPAIKVSDGGGRTSKHDEVGDTSRGPVIDCTS